MRRNSRRKSKAHRPQGRVGEITMIFIDTETTNKENGQLVQVAYKAPEWGNVKVAYFNPPERISYEAMAIHHITNEFAMKQELFQGSDTKKELQELFTDCQKCFIAHNAKFDIDVLERAGIKVDRFIDTLKIARKVYPDLEFYNLQYLRYKLNLKLGCEVTPHDAFGDVIVLEKLFNNLFENFHDIPDAEIIDEMIEISKNPILLKTIQFGKYKGQTFDWIKENNRGYLVWLSDQKDINEDLQFTLNKILRGEEKH